MGVGENRCPRCGAALPGGISEGDCPRCLLRLGLEGRSGAGDEPAESRSTEAAPGPHSSPERIGPYRILELLGEGGMGVVYLAEQEAPVRRRVALKLIKPGMDSRQILARFESERQALAILNHPNVAKVFDAGATEDGRPYFVMEHVPGVPITSYCDSRRLGLPERLGLFMQACEAIQHAHQKGILHRDVKPSNVLVAEQDGKPLVKVIDFGVAKATSQKLTERTLFTQHGLLIGTPEYMSPEQAGTTGLEVDSRTDIYSLGVVLYELLVGALPFDPATLRQAAVVEMLRIIQEVEPPKPTTRIGNLGDSAQEIARHRHTDVRSLVRQVRGDLEWITMRALEKDPGRRYPSASELAADISRHLEDEPVTAGPPRITYRLKKLVKRQKKTFAAASVVLMALVAGLVASTALYLRSEAQRARAEIEVEAWQAALRGEPERYRVLSRQALERHRRALGKGNPALAPYLVNRLFMLKWLSGSADRRELRETEQEAVELVERSLDAGDVEAVGTLLLLLNDQEEGDDARLLELYRRAFELLEKEGAKADQGMLEALADLLEARGHDAALGAGDEEIERTCRQILGLRRRSLSPGSTKLVRSIENLADILERKGATVRRGGSPAQAEPALREALALLQEVGPAAGLRVAEVESELGASLAALGGPTRPSRCCCALTGSLWIVSATRARRLRWRRPD